MAAGRGARSGPANDPHATLLSSVTLPKGGGAIRSIDEKFSTNPSTGTASLRIPIACPSGRAGFGISLELSYDSGSGNGPFGLGWHLSIPAISRKTDRGVPRYGADDEFVLSGAEELVPVDGGVPRTEGADDYTVRRYRPRVENLHARIERWTRHRDGDVHWRVTSKDDVLNVYGRSEKTRLTDPEHPDRVFSWLLEETRDDRGNIARYTYMQEDGAGVERTRASEAHRFGEGGLFLARAQRYLKKIEYGNRAPNVASDWLFTVVFDYGEHDPQAPAPDDAGMWAVRADPFSSFRSGFELRTYRLCRRVLVFHCFPDSDLGDDPVLVRSNDFEYRPSPAATYLASATQTGWERKGSGYVSRSLPKLALGYGTVDWNDAATAVDPESLVGIGAGVHGGRSQWVDLDGEGLPGALISDERSWFYKRNLGGGRLGPPEAQRTLPAPSELHLASAHLSDVGNDGNLDLVQYAPPLSGFFERTVDEDWEPFAPFRSVPRIDWTDRNLRLVDVDGDGLADVLISEHDAFVYYRSRAKEGFEPPVRVAKASDDDSGPAVLFADETESIFLADMTGDGLADIVRVRVGEVSFWPALGHARYGRKVTLDWKRGDGTRGFDRPEQFDARRIRLADIDGTGPNDIVYFGPAGADVYLNESGNALATPRHVGSVPAVDSLASASILDLLGTGTACIVWSSATPGRNAAPLQYVDLLGGHKPHLLESIDDNMGSETRISYASSTKYYLDDRAAGRAWSTRLAFPVHIVKRVERIDHLSRSSLLTRYLYHHGFYDGVEREFRGFACVDQLDEEAFGTTRPPAGGGADTAEVIRQPPVRVTTWFHTGAWLGRDRLEAALRGEYWRGDPAMPLLPDTPALPGADARLEREAARALRGSVLRQETYAEDGTAAAGTPYLVSERSYAVRALPTADGAGHGVFLVHPSESFELHYERDPSDPRTVHELVLAVDDFGNVLRSAKVAYGRTVPDPDLPQRFRDAQARTWVAYSKNSFTDPVDTAAGYRTPLPADARVYELTGAAPAGRLFTPLELGDQFVAAKGIDYGDSPTPGQLERRRIEHTRTIYRSDDLRKALPLGQAGARALPFEKYQLAFTERLLGDVYRRGAEDLLPYAGALKDACGYRTRAELVDAKLSPATDADDADGDLWVPSGRVFYSEVAASAAAELSEAVASFFLPKRAEDAFGNASTVRYDAYALQVVRAEDEVKNVVTAEIDYRVLGPRLVTDANLNRSAAAFDTLGVVTATAVMGKETESVGDRLAGFSTDDAEVAAFFGDPLPHVKALLGEATVRFVYDLDAFQATRASASPQPVAVATLARETHARAPGGAASRVQVTLTYFDGFGRELQKKARAESGPLSAGWAAIDPRWLGSGWVVLNNKGKPVRRYEPFFSAEHRFEFARSEGVATTLFYDPVDRVVATLFPDRTYEKVLFDAWREEHHDRNDTVDRAPAKDPDFGEWFGLLPLSEVSPSWSSERLQGEELRAAQGAAVHAGTPKRTYVDALGRRALVVAHCRRLDADGKPVDEILPTFMAFDIEGNLVEVLDAKRRSAATSLATVHDEGRVAMRYRHDVLGRRIFESCMDAGQRWALLDVEDEEAFAWDSRGHAFRFEFDAARRPARSFVRGHDPSDPAKEIRYQEVVYGEGAADDQKLNLRSRPHVVRDTSGRLTYQQYDFKGNATAVLRELAREYRSAIDWGAGAVAMDGTAYPTLTTFDALDRPIEIAVRDGSRILHRYNARGLLEAVDAAHQGGAVKPYVEAITFDPKGQRLGIRHGNGVTTAYEYDPLTFRLLTLTTRRASSSVLVQRLVYTYDPVGNVTSLADEAQREVYFDGAVVRPIARYMYDALYQLRAATGREHVGQAGTPQTTWDDVGRIKLEHPHDGSKMREYLESYAYDEAGNLLSVAHAASGGDWTRTYAYDRGSRNENARTGNALTETTVAGAKTAYGHDEHGNVASMGHLPLMRWDHLDRLSVTSRQVVSAGTPETTYYTYDGAGERARKVTDPQDSTQPSSERVYVGPYELYREYDTHGAVTLERESLHVMDGERRVALIETHVDQVDEPLVRYQLSNHLGSSCVELDGTPQARVVSYEEYYPFGATSYQAQRTQTTASKRYRYTAKERDEESGLEPHSARFYAPWLARWTSVDPERTDHHPNRYVYVNNNPVTFSDSTGLWPESLKKKWEQVKAASNALATGAYHAVAEGALWNPGKMAKTARDMWNMNVRGVVLDKLAGNWSGRYREGADIIGKRVIDQVKSTWEKGRGLRRLAQAGTRGAAKYIEQAGEYTKAARAWIIKPTGTSKKEMLDALEGAVARMRSHKAVTKLAPKVTTGLPGPIGTALKVMAPVGAVLGTAGAIENAKKGDWGATMRDAATAVSGTLESAAIASSWVGGGAAAGGTGGAAATGGGLALTGGVGGALATGGAVVGAFAIGAAIGTGMEKGLDISKHASEAGMRVSESLRQRGWENTGFVLGAAATVAVATNPGTWAYAAYRKIAD